MHMERVSMMCNLADSSHNIERSELPCIRAGRACQCECIDVSYLNNGRVQVPQEGCTLFTCIRFPCCSGLCFLIVSERLMLDTWPRYQMIDICMLCLTMCDMCCSDHRFWTWWQKVWVEHGRYVYPMLFSGCPWERSKRRISLDPHWCVDEVYAKKVCMLISRIHGNIMKTRSTAMCDHHG
jgi:hypothetical protein